MPGGSTVDSMDCQSSQLRAEDEAQHRRHLPLSDDRGQHQHQLQQSGHATPPTDECRQPAGAGRPLQPPPPQSHPGQPAHGERSALHAQQYLRDINDQPRPGSTMPPQPLHHSRQPSEWSSHASQTSQRQPPRQQGQTWGSPHYQQSAQPAEWSSHASQTSQRQSPRQQGQTWGIPHYQQCAQPADSLSVSSSLASRTDTLTISTVEFNDAADAVSGASSHRPVKRASTWSNRHKRKGRPAIPQHMQQFTNGADTFTSTPGGSSIQQLNRPAYI